MVNIGESEAAIITDLQDVLGNDGTNWTSEHAREMTRKLITGEAIKLDEMNVRGSSKARVAELQEKFDAIAGNQSIEANISGKLAITPVHRSTFTPGYVVNRETLGFGGNDWTTRDFLGRQPTDFEQYWDDGDWQGRGRGEILVTNNDQRTAIGRILTRFERQPNVQHQGAWGNAAFAMGQGWNDGATVDVSKANIEGLSPVQIASLNADIDKISSELPITFSGRFALPAPPATEEPGNGLPDNFNVADLGLGIAGTPDQISAKIRELFGVTPSNAVVNELYSGKRISAQSLRGA